MRKCTKLRCKLKEEELDTLGLALTAVQEVLTHVHLMEKKCWHGKEVNKILNMQIMWQIQLAKDNKCFQHLRSMAISASFHLVSLTDKMRKTMAN